MAKNGGSGNGSRKKKPMLKPGDEQLVRAVLSSFRKTKDKLLIEMDERHVAEVLEALRISGFVIIPRGVLDSIRKILAAYDETL